MKVIIAGGRDFNDFELMKKKCDKILSNIKVTEIVSGGAAGADTLAERYAFGCGYNFKKFPANWEDLGKAAGVIRNGDMSLYSDALIAFWDGESRGTKHMIDIAKRDGLLIRVIRY